jgi:hypothetical protein
MAELSVKRWRAYLRAIHRDIGYLAIGFTVIYAISGIAQNHLEDWGEVSYKSYEQTLALPPIGDGVPDAQAIAIVVAKVGLGAPTSALRAGDEIRLEYASGAKVSAIGDRITVQGRSQRFFIGAANWLHRARNKHAWKYVSDTFAAMLLYLAISGVFMIKGRLGFRWRGMILISIGVAVPVTAVLVGREGAAVEESVAAEARPLPRPAAKPDDEHLPPPVIPAAKATEPPDDDHLPPPVIPDKYKTTDGDRASPPTK